jgi:ABC-type glutathione transport system ATPase component
MGAARGGNGMNTASPMLELRELSVSFPVKGAEPVRAVRGVSLSVATRETLGLVGESGCGKTTLSRAVLGLLPFGGDVRLKGEPLNWKAGGRELRRRVQLVFQDPFASLNPRMTVQQALQEPLRVHFRLEPAERDRRVREMLDRVGLAAESQGKYPHEFSGGQRQRIAIARALILEPEVVIADEPVSALDVSIQAQILNLLSDLKRDMGLTMLFISHDLSVVRHVADRVAVMSKGEIVEQGAVEQVMESPEHDYTKALLKAVY